MKWGVIFIALAVLLPKAFSQGVQVYDARKNYPKQNPSEKLSADEEAVDKLEQELAAQNKAMSAAGDFLESPEEKKEREYKEQEAQDAKEAQEAEEKEKGPALSKDLLDIQAELQAGKSSMDLLQDPKLRKKLIAAYQNNPMSLMPIEMLHDAVGSQVKKTQIGFIFEKFPKLLDFLVNFMHHPRALGQAVKVLDRTDDLKFCGYVSIVLFIFAFLLRKKLITEDTKFLNRLLIKVSMSFGFMGLSLGYLYMTFNEELSPAVEVFKKTFF
ncbi:MAG: hypothetical protein K2P81_03050 [Bacteriovoracaceae bacterium]|nr:hypothetical protein [Bacteriovoracaceae bacterium]